jgi:hypothetical protein
LERLIRQAGEKEWPFRASGAMARETRRSLWMKLSETLREMAEMGGWRSTKGASMAWAASRTSCADLAWPYALCWSLSSRYASFAMWRVEIADAGVYEADIRAYLNEEGIRPLRWKASVDPAALRDALEWRYPKVAWVECGWRGVTLKIRVIEGVSAGDTLTHLGSADIVASRDGVVDSVVTVAGTPQVIGRRHGAQGTGADSGTGAHLRGRDAACFRPGNGDGPRLGWRDRPYERCADGDRLHRAHAGNPYGSFAVV